jgi:hypothetical protein
LNETARLVVSASGRAEREFFSDFADRLVARRRYGESLTRRGSELMLAASIGIHHERHEGYEKGISFGYFDG